MNKTGKKETIRCFLDIKVGEYGAVCLPSNEGSTGYHWILPAVPENINRTADGWFPAITVPPGAVGTPGFHYFAFIGVTITPKTSPEMTFYLLPPGRDQKPVQEAICTVTVR